MQQFYKGHTIKTSARQLRDMQLWQPMLQIIIWNDIKNLFKPFSATEYFSTPEQAEREGLVIARKWIDDRKPDASNPLPPRDPVPSKRRFYDATIQRFLDFRPFYNRLSRRP